jgi:segregation and condensation protein A
MLNTAAIDVHLDIFEGPLDLLLYLIKKNNLDIYDIPISEITKEYLSYLDVMQDLNLDVAGEFLVMASTLMQIKARVLLPSQSAEEGDEGPDPRAELIEKLAEYQKYKEAARLLEERFEQFKDVCYRGAPHFAESEKTLDISFFDLLDAVRRALARVEGSSQEIYVDEFPIEVKMEKILNMVISRPWALLDDVFAGETKKMGVVTCFLALLELMKMRRVLVRQDGVFGEVRVYQRTQQEPEAAQPAA